MSRLIDGDDIDPAEGAQDVTDIEAGIVVVNELFHPLQGSLTAFDGGVARHGGVDEGMIGPVFTETAVNEEKEIEDGGRRMDKFLFVFPVKEGNGIGFTVIGDIPQGRAAVVQSGDVESGQAFSGFGKGFETDVGIGFFFGDALKGSADIFHDEKIFVEKDDFRSQGQAGIDSHDFIGFTPKSGRRILFGKGVAAITHAAFDKVVHSIERKGENPFIRVFGDYFLNLFEERRIEQESHTFLFSSISKTWFQYLPDSYMVYELIIANLGCKRNGILFKISVKYRG